MSQVFAHTSQVFTHTHTSQFFTLITRHDTIISFLHTNHKLFAHTSQHMKHASQAFTYSEKSQDSVKQTSQDYQILQGFKRHIPEPLSHWFTFYLPG